MAESYVLGIDLGTGSCKACIVDSSGRHWGQVPSAYETHFPHAGWAEQNPTDWLPAVKRSVRAVLSSVGVQPHQFIGLCLTSAAHIGVLTDGRGEPVRRAILWSDQRSVEQVLRIPKDIEEYIFVRTCNGASTTWTLPHMLWVRDREPRAWERARRLWLSKDYLLHHLTGESCTDRATAVSSMFYDVMTETWSEKLCSLVGIDPGFLPAVHPATHVAGGLLPAIAAELGLPSGLPVVNGTLDSATETYCAGALAAGDIVIRLGTAGGIHYVSDRARPHRKLMSYPHLVTPLWYSQAGTNSAGSAVGWALRALGGRTPLSNDELVALASEVPPGAEGVLFHPYLAGERSPHWDDRLRGSFAGFSMRHGPAHLARAVLEGVCFSLKDAASLFGDLGTEKGAVSVVGGGTANSLWTRILCDVFSRPMTILREAGSSYGAALLGLSALGVPIDPREAAIQRFLDPHEVVPDRSNVRAYEAAFAGYRLVSGRMRGICGELGAAGMRAGGEGKE